MKLSRKNFIKSLIVGFAGMQPAAKVITRAGKEFGDSQKLLKPKLEEIHKSKNRDKLYFNENDNLVINDYEIEQIHFHERDLKIGRDHGYKIIEHKGIKTKFLVQRHGQYNIKLPGKIIMLSYNYHG